MLTCGGCRRELPEDAFAKDKARSTGRRYRCRKCSSAEYKRWQSAGGYQARLSRNREARRLLKLSDPLTLWSRRVANAAQKRAKERGLPCTVTAAWLRSIAPTHCVLLGFELDYTNTKSTSASAALDRIDNDKGYTPDNCWVISMLANRVKSNATVEQVEMLAENLRAQIDKHTLQVLNDQALLAERPNPYAS